MADARRVADDLISVEEFYALVSDGRKADLIDEYWIIDPIQQRTEFLVLEEGRYRLAPLEQNRLFRSRALPGFWLDVDWLLADPPPPVSRCLNDILAAN
jgi:hypothetical protein